MAKRRKGNDDVLPWLLVGGGAGIGLYLLLKSKARPGPGVTRAAPVAPIRPPPAFANAESVSRRFGEVRELYTMGYLTPEETESQVAALAAALGELVRTGRASASEVDPIADEMAVFLERVEETRELLERPPA